MPITFSTVAKYLNKWTVLTFFILVYLSLHYFATRYLHYNLPIFDWAEPKRELTFFYYVLQLIIISSSLLLLVRRETFVRWWAGFASWFLLISIPIGLNIFSSSGEMFTMVFSSIFVMQMLLGTTLFFIIVFELPHWVRVIGMLLRIREPGKNKRALSGKYFYKYINKGTLFGSTLLLYLVIDYPELKLIIIGTLISATALLFADKETFIQWCFSFAWWAIPLHVILMVVQNTPERYFEVTALFYTSSIFVFTVSYVLSAHVLAQLKKYSTVSV